MLTTLSKHCPCHLCAEFCSGDRELQRKICHGSLDSHGGLDLKVQEKPVKMCKQMWSHQPDWGLICSLSSYGVTAELSGHLASTKNGVSATLCSFMPPPSPPLRKLSPPGSRSNFLSTLASGYHFSVYLEVKLPKLSSSGSAFIFGSSLSRDDELCGAGVTVPDMS